MIVLNLGCGVKTSDHRDVVNIDWSIYLKIKDSRILKSIIPILLNGERLEKFKAISSNTLARDLSKGIPFSSNSVDVVYHSHFLEHLDRGDAKEFLFEVRRVLKPDGIHRFVVPDFEKYCRDYISHIFLCQQNLKEISRHDSYISAIIEQSVRKEAFGSSQQRPLRRFLENVFLGDARRRGETHQWMYDRITLEHKLRGLGYREVHFQEYSSSLIQNWSDYRLDIDANGDQYRPDSLYVEAVK